MYLTRHMTQTGAVWAADSRRLRDGASLADLLALPASEMGRWLAAATGAELDAPLIAPIDAEQEVWAAGVTYLRSRAAREQESQSADVYARVYGAERPEIFHKAAGWRVMGPEQPVRVRRDSAWNVPEPEMTLVINRHGEVVGYCAGNDVSSRDIEGENPLYLPQAKVYDGSCALGPGIVLADPEAMRALPVRLAILRGGTEVFAGETSTSQMARGIEELAAYLFRELSFPYGAFLMTGTGIIPPDSFTLRPADVVRISVGELTLVNPVQ